MSELIKVWYQLYGESGKPFRKSTPTQATVAENANVDKFRKAVLAENKDGVLKGISAGQLQVYERQGNQGSSSAPLEIVDLSNLELLKGGTKVSGLGVNEDFALIVVVPVYGIFF